MPDLPTSPVYLLKRTELAVRGCVEKALGEVALTPSQYFVLFLVETGEATSSAELARATGVLPQSMAELISLLAKRELIARTPDSANNRILRIEVTAAGRKLFEKATELAIRVERELFEGFEPGEIDELLRLFGRLIASAERHSYHPKLRSLPTAGVKRQPARVARKAPATIAPVRRARRR